MVNATARVQHRVCRLRGDRLVLEPVAEAVGSGEVASDARQQEMSFIREGNAFGLKAGERGTGAVGLDGVECQDVGGPARRELSAAHRWDFSPVP
jgi:hypothetical protein